MMPPRLDHGGRPPRLCRKGLASRFEEGGNDNVDHRPRWGLTDVVRASFKRPPPLGSVTPLAHYGWVLAGGRPTAKVMPVVTSQSGAPRVIRGMPLLPPLHPW